MKNRKIETTSLCGFGVFLAFALLSGIVFSLFSPIVSTNAADTLTTKATANIRPVISVTAPNDADYAFGTVTPTDAGAFFSKSGNVQVKTNDINGFKLYISTNTSETALKATGVSTSIASCGDNVTSSSMDKDKWGFSTDGTTYNPVKATDTLIKEQTSPLTQTSAYSYPVHIGMKLSSALQSGTYSNTVKFTAIGNSSY